MSSLPLLQSFRRATSTSLCRRTYVTPSPAKLSSTPPPKRPAADEPISSCPENTVITGVNYLKGQPPVLALADDAYPNWLWTITKPKVYPDDGPGGRAEKAQRRKDNRQKIREQNFMKTQ